MKRPLTPKQRLFVHEYLIDFNGTQAAIRAGYSRTRSRVTACNLLKIPTVKKAVAEALAKRQEKLEITSEMWLRDLDSIRTADATGFVRRNAKLRAIEFKQFEEFPPGASKAIETIEETISPQTGRHLKIKLYSKLEAAKLIGQHLGFLKDPKIEIPGVERAIYELSERFLPVVKEREKTRSDEPK